MSKFVATNKNNGPRAYALPAEDQHPAVLVDLVEDEKAAKSAMERYGKSGFYFRFVFQLGTLVTEAEVNEAAARAGIPVTDKMKEAIGKRHLVRSRAFNMTLNEKGSLLPFLKAWVGKGLPKNIEEFNLEDLLGANAVVTIEHSVDEKDPKKIYSNISAIAPLNDRMKKLFDLESALVPADYIRIQDRPAQGAAGSTTAVTEDTTTEDESI